MCEALLVGADEQLARASDDIEPRPHDPEVLLLITHVVLVVPRQMIASPFRIEVRATMIATIATQAIPDRRRVERRDRKQRCVRGGDHREPDRFARLRRRAPHRAFVRRIVATVLAHRLMMIVIVEREPTRLVATEAVQHVFV